MMSIMRPFIAIHRDKKVIKMLIIYPNFKIGDKLSHYLYISLFDLCFSPLMKVQNLVCFHVLIQKSGSTKITLSKIMPPKYQIYRSHIHF